MLHKFGLYEIKFEKNVLLSSKTDINKMMRKGSPWSNPNGRTLQTEEKKHKI